MVNLLIKKLSMVLLLVFVLVIFIISLVDLETLYNDAGKVFFSSNGYFDTGSRNLVTAIYLDYRLFDSLFEAGILLVAVSGVLWISQHKIKEKNATFMMDKQKTPELFITFGRLLYPVMLLFGLYIILNGHRSPGGGFQGGAIMATAILILYYIDISKEIDVQTIITIEKILFLLLVSISFLSFFTRGDIMTNFIPLNGDIAFKQIYLYLLNIIIGAKVALGLVAVFTSFLKEGR
jgi:multicomponent Na+:H+ antiporter subunit B